MNHCESSNEEDLVPISMGFGASMGDPEPMGRHKHSFHQFDGSAPYFKNQDSSQGWLTVYCECGETKELLVENRK